MILFLDTEFTDFQQPDLISLGLVSECGCHEFYAERNDFDLARCSDFVQSTVLPKLGQSQSGVDRTTLARTLRTWLEGIHAVDNQSPVLVLYDYDTDFELFRQALTDPISPWIEGANVADKVNPFSWARAGLIESPDAHHALHDARELRADWLAARAQAQ
ncbi:hypothetical protein ACLSSQ_17640 [Azospira sp. APE16]|uniref:hypothetical protein n=1 Tax=Azospira sp. APE16 TaxID=3394231 RepID=UPI003A4D7600